jgi:diguanylate cyclase (GGDEF)-like protein
MADLDHFKKVNDTYGHDAGDTVLKTFADILKTNTRRSNICGRLGGEEFVLILTHTNKEQTEIAVERIRDGFATEKFGRNRDREFRYCWIQREKRSRI